MKRDIVRLAVPMMVASLATATAQLVIVGMVGHLGARALYVRAAYMPIVFVFLAFGEALSATTQVAVALSRGRGDDRAGVRTAARLLLLGAVAGGLVISGGSLFATELASFVGAPPEVSGALTSFVRWMSTASVLVFVPLVCAATLRGLGRPRAAAAVTLTYVIVDLAAVAVAAYGLHAGVESLAWAVGLSAVVAAAVGLTLLRDELALGRAKDAGRALAPALGLLRSVGLPILGSYVALFASSLLVIRIIRRFGPDIVSGFSVGYSLQTLAIVPAIALGSACAIHINQLRGAGRGGAAGEALSVALGLAVRIYLAVAAAITGLALVAPGLITSSAGAASAAREYLLVVGPSLAALGVVLVVLTVLEQVGAGIAALGCNIVYIVGFTTIGGALTARSQTPLPLYLTIALVSVVGAPAVVALGRRSVGRLARDPDGPVIAYGAITPTLRDAVHELFVADDFLFKTYLPSLASEADIERLLTAQTQVLTRDGRVIGLAELETVAAHAGHYRLHYRVAGDLPVDESAAALEGLLGNELDEREILRLTFLVHEFDAAGRELAERLRFAHEGLLPGIGARGGRRHGVHYYARVADASMS